MAVNTNSPNGTLFGEAKQTNKPTEHRHTAANLNHAQILHQHKMCASFLY
jgi:hypothetical protein